VRPAPVSWGFYQVQMTDRPRYHLTLEALPDRVPANMSLRRFLKTALRGYGLRCTPHEELPPASDGAGQAPTPDVTPHTSDPR
jgi:hypothetical protein